MKAPTDQKDLRMLAEKVMRWQFIEWVPDGLWFKSTERELYVSTADNSGWNPFANPADAVLLMEALPNIRVAVTYWREYGDAPYRAYASGFRKHWEIEGVSGTEYARTLTEAILKVLKERPELFEVATK